MLLTMNTCNILQNKKTNMNTNHNLVKFRPVLTVAQISYIISLTEHNSDKRDSKSDQEIRKILVPILAKIEVGAINPAYKLSEIHAAKTAERTESSRYNNGEMSAQEEAEYEAKIMGI